MINTVSLEDGPVHHGTTEYQCVKQTQSFSCMHVLGTEYMQDNLHL
jgi:hypothetical protein